VGVSHMWDNLRQLSELANFYPAEPVACKPFHGQGWTSDSPLARMSWADRGKTPRILDKAPVSHIACL